MESAALAIEKAIERILKRGVRTADLPGNALSSPTTKMGDLIAETTRQILKPSRSKQR